MSDAERSARAHDAFAKILARFLVLPQTRSTGSFTVHFKNGEIKNVEWRDVESLDFRESA